MKSCTDVQLGEAELKIRTRGAGGDSLGVRDEGLVVVELLDSKFEHRYSANCLQTRERKRDSNRV